MAERRACAECGVPVRPGDGGIRAFGRLFCSELCADCQDPAFGDDLEAREAWQRNNGPVYEPIERWTDD